MFERFFPVRRQSAPAPEAQSPWDAVERFWRDPFPAMSGFPFTQETTPRMDVSETENEVLVNAEIPGLEPKDVELTIENNLLTIKGHKREETAEKKGETVHRREIRYGSFSRSVLLPGEVLADKASAVFDKGVLKVTLPKAAGGGATRVQVTGG